MLLPWSRLTSTKPIWTNNGSVGDLFIFIYCAHGDKLCRISCHGGMGNLLFLCTAWMAINHGKLGFFVLGTLQHRTLGIADRASRRHSTVGKKGSLRCCFNLVFQTQILCCSLNTIVRLPSTLKNNESSPNLHENVIRIVKPEIRDVEVGKVQADIA